MRGEDKLENKAGSSYLTTLLTHKVAAVSVQVLQAAVMHRVLWASSNCGGDCSGPNALWVFLHG